MQRSLVQFWQEAIFFFSL
ncbi:unnamed protein product [Debaryomyces tyrocola]|nr:unnamed protein product [Debaryomyces tyrocola]